MKTQDLLKYGTVAVGAISATVLLLNYLNDREHKRLQLELTKLQLDEVKAKNGNNFRNFTPPTDITAAIPTQKSGTQDWCTFYDLLKSRYGKSSAELIFVKAWSKRKGSSVNTIGVKECTGLALDTTWKDEALAKANKLADTAFQSFESNFKFVSSTPKILFWGGIALLGVIVAIGGYKAITTRPDQKGLGEGLGIGLGKSMTGGI